VPVVDPPIAASFVSDHSGEITAVLTVILAFVLARVVDRSLIQRVLASSAVLGLVIGFAARQTLANGIAGILLAITQPIRIGDLVTFEEQTGEVEDIRLTYTYVRCLDGRRLIVPNERLAQSSIQNHTIVDPGLEIEVSVWVKEGKDALRALDLLAQDEGVQARVAEIDKEGVRLAVTTWADSPRNRGKVATRLREESLRRLAGEGLS
jgi:small conductance mechanosensitive channel